MRKRAVGFMLALLLGACAGTENSPEPTTSLPSLAARVAEDPGLATLGAALRRAGLDAKLADTAGTFTIFAPSDGAFAKAGIDPEKIDVATLRDVLAYHVVPGIARAADLGTGTWGTLQGGFVRSRTEGTRVTLDAGARVTQADIEAANGVLHVVDAVLTPPTDSLPDLVAADPRLGKLAAALAKTGLDDALRGRGPFTLFAPTDEAFAAAATALAALDDAALAALLRAHVAPGRVFTTDFTDGELPTLNDGRPLVIDRAARTISGAALIDDATDLQATNGVVHAVDAVILP